MFGKLSKRIEAAIEWQDVTLSRIGEMEKKLNRIIVLMERMTASRMEAYFENEGLKEKVRLLEEQLRVSELRQGRPQSTRDYLIKKEYER